MQKHRTGGCDGSWATFVRMVLLCGELSFVVTVPARGAPAQCGSERKSSGPEPEAGLPGLEVQAESLEPMFI